MGKKNKIRKITGDLTDEFADIFAEVPPEESFNSRTRNTISRSSVLNPSKNHPILMRETWMNGWLKMLRSLN